MEALDGGVADVIVTEREKFDGGVESDERHEKNKTAIPQIVVVEIKFSETACPQITQSAERGFRQSALNPDPDSYCALHKRKVRKLFKTMVSQITGKLCSSNQLLLKISLSTDVVR